MRVLMFGWEFPPFNSGGLGVACLGLTKALISEGAQVTFVLPKKVDLKNPHDIRVLFAEDPSIVENIKILPVATLLTPYVTSQSYVSLLGRDALENKMYGNSLFEEVHRYALLAREIAKREDFDIIHAHDWLSFLAGMEAKKISGKPLIIHVHATSFDWTGGHLNQPVFEIEKEAMEYADAIVAVSQFTKDLIVSKYGINPDKIEVAHNGISIEEYHQSYEHDKVLQQFRDQGCKVVLFVGRITIQKGPDYFLKSAKKVLEYNPNVIFVFAGSGDMEQQIIQEAANMGISDKIIFTGFLRGEELNRVYASADLFVLPSVSEPFGIVPLEALANGTPVLISKQSGVSEVLTHALKTDFWDVDDMADKILSVVEHDSLKDTLKDNGREEVKGMSWHKAAKVCMNLYYKFLGKNRE